MKWIGQHIWRFVSRFRSDVYLESLSTSTSDDKILVVDNTTGKVSKGAGFILEDGDTTEVTIGNGKEVKFVEGDAGININWTDTSDGSDADPYDLTFYNTVYGKYHGHSFLWVLPGDFVSDLAGLIYNSGGVIDKTSSAKLYAFVLIPVGATATSIEVFGNDTSDFAVFEKTPNAATETARGTGAVGTGLDLSSAVAGSNANGTYLAIQITPDDQDTTRIYGAKITTS